MGRPARGHSRWRPFDVTGSAYRRGRTRTYHNDEQRRSEVLSIDHRARAYPLSISQPGSGRTEAIRSAPGHVAPLDLGAVWHSCQLKVGHGHVGELSFECGCDEGGSGCHQ